MKIDKTKLKQALETVKPGLANKESIDQATSFCFLGGHVVTYNDEISISYPIEVDFSGAVNSTELYAFVNKTKSDVIEMEVVESELLLKANRAKAGLRIQSEVTLPLSEIGKVKKWKALPADFLKSLSFCMGAVSKDMSNPKLTCVHVTGAYAEASDNYRLSHFILDSPFKINEFLIPGVICTKVINFSPTEISEGDSWIHFKNADNAILSCRIFSETFPDTSPLLNVNGNEILFPKEIITILERAQDFYKKDSILNESVKVSFEDKYCKIRAESDNAWFEERAKCEHSGESIHFNVTPYLLKDILKETSIAYYNKNRLFFETKNWKYLTMLRG